MIPEKYTKLIGTTQIFSGGLFGSNKSYPEEEYEVLKCRWGSATIMDMKTFKSKHPTVEYLIKNSSMKRSRWTRGFAVREIELKDQD